MAQYILSTLEALACGDISKADASYSLSAHIVQSAERYNRFVGDSAIQPYVDAVAHAVAQGHLAPLVASRYLIIVMEKLSQGLPLDEILAANPADLQGG
jgi:hypothetical protein